MARTASICSSFLSLVPSGRVKGLWSGRFHFVRSGGSFMREAFCNQSVCNATLLHKSIGHTYTDTGYDLTKWLLADLGMSVLLWCIQGHI